MFRVSDLPWLGGNQRENSFYPYQNFEMCISFVAKGLALVNDEATTREAEERGIGND